MSLRLWNAGLALLHAGQGGLILVLSNDFTLPVTISFLEEPMTEPQSRTLGWFAEHGIGTAGASLTYGEARQTIRRLVALRGLRSA